MAEAVFKHVVEEKGYSEYFSEIESFGTSGWHVGDSPDSRTVKTCRHYGVPISHNAQQITPRDFRRFDYVIAMDESNKSDLLHMKPRDSKTHVAMFGEWGTDPRYGKVITDPYYGGINGFERCYQQLNHFSENFLNKEIGEL